MNRSKIKILVADDDAEDVQLLVEVLSEIVPGSEFLKAKNGIECLRNLATKEKPDLVLLDLNIPIKNGIECLRDISNQELLPNTPIIIYSTSHNIKDIDAAYKYGARAYLVKPTSFAALKQLMKIVLSKLADPLSLQMDKANFVIWDKRLQLG